MGAGFGQDSHQLQSAAQRAEEARRRAIATERRAIDVHETAAARQDQVADTTEERARSLLAARDQERLQDRAARERGRAAAARQRAQHARDRLKGDGVEVP